MGTLLQAESLRAVSFSLQTVRGAAVCPAGEEDHAGRVPQAALQAPQLPLVRLHEPDPGRCRADTPQPSDSPDEPLAQVA